MIKLSTSAQNLQFSNLKYPPTHAALVSRTIMNGVGSSSMDVTGLSLNYWYGTLDATGKFVPDLTMPTCVINIPDTNTVARYSLPVCLLVLKNLFSPGVTPLPSDPTQSTNVPSKVWGDHKIMDIDIVASFLEPKVNGTPI